MEWMVYLLRCRDGTLYTGCTNNLPHRLCAHNEGKGAKYTRARRPVVLVYQESCQGRSEALKREAAIKRLPKAQKEALVAERKKIKMVLAFLAPLCYYIGAEYSSPNKSGCGEVWYRA